MRLAVFSSQLANSASQAEEELLLIGDCRHPASAPRLPRAFGGALELAGKLQGTGKDRPGRCPRARFGYCGRCSLEIRRRAARVISITAIRPPALWPLGQLSKKSGRTPIGNNSGILVASLPAALVQRLNRKRYKLLTALSFSCVSVARGASRQGRPALAKMTVGRRRGFRDSAACSTVVKASECRAN